MQREHVALGEERRLVGRRRVAVAARALERGLARPHENVHAEGLAVAGYHLADASVAVDAERLTAQPVADARLPVARLERLHLLRNLAHSGQHQCPGELRGGKRRRSRMLARRDDDAERGAGVDVDVRIDAALTDELEACEPLEQRCSNGGALADEHQRLRIAQALCERVQLLDVIVPDGDLVAVELGEAVQRAKRVEVIVEDADFHVLALASPPNAFARAW